MDSCLEGNLLFSIEEVVSCHTSFHTIIEDIYRCALDHVTCNRCLQDSLQSLVYDPQSIIKIRGNVPPRFLVILKYSLQFY